MAKEVIVPTQGIRERHLNIVYFVDSSKSHSIRINLTLARWLFAGGIGLILWSILSLGWIISLGRVLNMTREHLGTALTSIFDYQVKYDHVFDLAYPDNSTQGYYATGSHLPANSPTVSDTSAKSPPPEIAKPDESTAAAGKPDPSSLAQTTVQPHDEAKAGTDNPTEQSASQAGTEKPTTASLTMDIRNPSLVAQNGTMTLLFDILNRNGAQKAEGYIWAIANIQLQDGSKKAIAAPSHSRLNKEGSIDAYSTTYKFSIQKFKRKDFTFAVPKGENWKILDLNISYVNPQGKSKQTIPVTIPVKFQDGASNQGSDAAAQTERSEETAQP